MLDSSATINFAEGAAGGGILSTLLMFGAMFAILYFYLDQASAETTEKTSSIVGWFKKRR